MPCGGSAPLLAPQHVNSSRNNGPCPSNNENRAPNVLPQHPPFVDVKKEAELALLESTAVREKEWQLQQGSGAQPSLLGAAADDDHLASTTTPTASALLPLRYLVHPVDGSVVLDEHNRPLTVNRLLATKPLQSELCSRPGPGNKRLTYLSGESVTRLLNELFGYDGWNLQVLKLDKIECTPQPNKFQVAYMAHVRITLQEGGAYREDVGFGDATDKQLCTAVSHAVKSAVTDALKRAARHFGDRLGNVLYDGNFSIKNAPTTLAQALGQYDQRRAERYNWNTNPGKANNPHVPPRPTSSTAPPPHAMTTPPGQLKNPPQSSALVAQPSSMASTASFGGSSVSHTTPPVPTMQGHHSTGQANPILPSSAIPPPAMSLPRDQSRNAALQSSFSSHQSLTAARMPRPPSHPVQSTFGNVVDSLDLAVTHPAVATPSVDGTGDSPTTSSSSSMMSIRSLPSTLQESTHSGAPASWMPPPTLPQSCPPTSWGHPRPPVTSQAIVTPIHTSPHPGLPTSLPTKRPLEDGPMSGRQPPHPQAFLALRQLSPVPPNPSNATTTNNNSSSSSAANFVKKTNPYQQVPPPAAGG